MENKEIEKEIVKILDKITDYKVPCDCPKGGIIEMMDGNHSYTCPKCDGSEWVVNPKLVKELLALHPQQPLERIPKQVYAIPEDKIQDYEAKIEYEDKVEPLQNGERDFRDLCSYRLDGELWIYSEKELKHSGGSFVEWIEKHGTKLSDLLSQSKKEGIFTDGEKEVILEALYSWEFHIRRFQSEYGSTKMLRNGYHEDIKNAYKKLESLTNQKKEDENKTA